VTLSYAEARRALDAAIAKAEELGASLGIAVVDARGFPVAVGRMDGVPPVAPDIAVGKARASALFGAPSGALATALPEAIARGAQESAGGRLVIWQGAVPLRRGDELIGGIGAGGASEEEDELVAQAGADAIG
jgi:uncharacterized protein GlcG (DUF336 family)